MLCPSQGWKRKIRFMVESSKLTWCRRWSQQTIETTSGQRYVDRKMILDCERKLEWWWMVAWWVIIGEIMGRAEWDSLWTSGQGSWLDPGRPNVDVILDQRRRRWTNNYISIGLTYRIGWDGPIPANKMKKQRCCIVGPPPTVLAQHYNNLWSKFGKNYCQRLDNIESMARIGRKCV